MIYFARAFFGKLMWALYHLGLPLVRLFPQETSAKIKKVISLIEDEQMFIEKKTKLMSMSLLRGREFARKRQRGLRSLLTNERNHLSNFFH